MFEGPCEWAAHSAVHRLTAAHPVLHAADLQPDPCCAQPAAHRRPRCADTAAACLAQPLDLAPQRSHAGGLHMRTQDCAVNDSNRDASHRGGCLRATWPGASKPMYEAWRSCDEPSGSPARTPCRPLKPQRRVGRQRGRVWSVARTSGAGVCRSFLRDERIGGALSHTHRTPSHSSRWWNP